MSHHRPNPSPQGLNDFMVIRYLNRKKNPADVFKIVRDAGHQLPHDTMTSAELVKQSQQRAQKILDSTDGAQRIQEAERVEIARRVNLRLSSPAGNQALAAALSQETVERVGAHDEQLAALCRKAVKDEVDAWLASKQGKEAYDQLLAEALDEKICQAEALRRRTWISLRLAQTGRAALVGQNAGA